MLRARLCVAGVLVASVALAWSCGGTLASSPDGGAADASTSSSGSDSGIVSSSGSTSSGSTSSGGSSGSGGSSSGSSGSSSGGSGSSSGGPWCNDGCTNDWVCQNDCPKIANGILCCNQFSGACYPTTNSVCWSVPDAGCPTTPTTNPICPVAHGGKLPANPNTGKPGCDGCIECTSGASWCFCAGDSADDNSGCLGFVNCVLTCMNGNTDAGAVPPYGVDPNACETQCAPLYKGQHVLYGDDLIGDLQQNCSSAAACGR